MTPTKEVATMDETHPVIQRLENLCEEMGVDSTSAALAIAQSILESDDIEALLDGDTQATVLNGDDYIGEAFMLNGIHGIGRSTFENSPLPYFLILDVKLAGADDDDLMTTGSTNVVATVIKLREAGALPRMVKIIQAGKPTSNGYYPQWLRKATDEDLAKSKVARRGKGSHTLDDGSAF